MFQSSRIASGSATWQAPSACSPSSASVIWNSMPSRIRRATLRMTLESSTTRQDFMTRYSSKTTCCPLANSRSRRAASDVQHTVHIELDQKLALEPEDAGGDPRQPGIEIGGLGLARAIGKRHHLADRIDQKAIGLAFELNADRHDRASRLVRAEIEPRAHVDRGHDAAAQI